MAYAGAHIKMHARGRNRVLADLPATLAYGWGASVIGVGALKAIAERVPGPAYLVGQGGGDIQASAYLLTGAGLIGVVTLLGKFGEVVNTWIKTRQEGAAGQLASLKATFADFEARIDEERESFRLQVEAERRENAVLRERIEARDRELESIVEHNAMLLERNKRLWGMLIERANLILGTRDGVPTAHPAVVVDKLTVIPKPDPLDDTPSPDVK